MGAVVLWEGAVISHCSVGLGSLVSQTDNPSLLSPIAQAMDCPTLDQKMFPKHISSVLLLPPVLSPSLGNPCAPNSRPTGVVYVFLFATGPLVTTAPFLRSSLPWELHNITADVSYIPRKPYSEAGSCLPDLLS